MQITNLSLCFEFRSLCDHREQWRFLRAPLSTLAAASRMGAWGVLLRTISVSSPNLAALFRQIPNPLQLVEFRSTLCCTSA